MYDRTELGYRRTHCECDLCRECCKHVPGALIPSDIERMSLACGFSNPIEFAKQYLVASEGALVLTPLGPMRVHSIVPARKEDGTCIFLTDDEKCSIHKDSPFGCAFFDLHEDCEQAHDKAKMYNITLMKSWETRDDGYADIWELLALMNRYQQYPERQIEELHKRVKEIENGIEKTD